MLFSLISQTCNSVHPLCFPYCGQSIQQWRAAVSVLKRGKGSQPKHGTASQGFSLVPVKRLRYQEVGELLFLFHPPAFRVCIFQLLLPLQLSYPDCSSHPQCTPPMEKPKSCALESCIPTTGWAGPWNSSAVPVLLCPYSVW